MGGGSPTIVQDSYRFRNDDGNETGATWVNNINVDSTLDVDTNYRLRFLVKNTGTAALNNIDLEFQYNLGGAGWNNITTTSSVVKALADGGALIADAADCTQQLGSGTFHTNNDGFTEDGISGGNNLDLAAGSETETELCFTIVSGDVVHNNTIQFRLLRDGGTSLDTYTRTPTATVNEPTVATGTSSITNAADTVSSAAAVSVSAASSITEGADTASSTATVAVGATSGITEGADTLAGTATVTDPAILGTASITEGADTLSGAAAVGIAGTSAITEGADTSSGAATVSVAATSSITEGADTLSSSGAVAIDATSAITEGADTLSSAAAVAISGAASITEGADTLVGTATVSDGPAGSAAITEGADTASGAATVAIAASSSITEAADTCVGTATVSVTATAAITEGADAASSAAEVTGIALGTAAITEGADTCVGVALVTTPQPTPRKHDVAWPRPKRARALRSVTRVRRR